MVGLWLGVRERVCVCEAVLVLLGVAVTVGLWLGVRDSVCVCEGVKESVCEADVVWLGV